MRFYEKKRCRNENYIYNQKGIFGILRNCWVSQQKWWVPQAVTASEMELVLAEYQGKYMATIVKKLAHKT